MAKVKLAEHKVEFFENEGDLVQVNTEDGPGYFPVMSVSVSIDGKLYHHPSTFLAGWIDTEDDSVFVDSRWKLRDFIEKIKEVGVINLEKWIDDKDLPEPPSLEEKWAHEAEMEQMERMGYYR